MGKGDCDISTLGLSRNRRPKGVGACGGGAQVSFVTSWCAHLGGRPKPHGPQCSVSPSPSEQQPPSRPFCAAGHRLQCSSPCPRKPRGHTELRSSGFTPHTLCTPHWLPQGSWAGLTLAFSSRNSGWSGVVWARHCSTSGRNRNCAERPPQSSSASRERRPPHPPRYWPVTFLAWSLSSRWASSLPEACAILFPATRFPTIMEAGPTSRKGEGAE